MERRGLPSPSSPPSPATSADLTPSSATSADLTPWDGDTYPDLFGGSPCSAAQSSISCLADPTPDLHRGTLCPAGSAHSGSTVPGSGALCTTDPAPHDGSSCSGSWNGVCRSAGPASGGEPYLTCYGDPTACGGNSDPPHSDPVSVPV